MHRVIVSRSLQPSHAKVTDATENDHYWRVLHCLWVGARRRGFPSCNPKSISRDSLQTLQHHSYDICLKSDGIRYVLLLTCRAGDADAPVALMIDRSRNMYEVMVVAPDEYFVKGTVMEGELVWRQPDEQEMIFFVFDAICVKGESLTSKPFHVRIRRTHLMLQHSDDLQGAADIEERVLETDCIVMVHYNPRIKLRAKQFVCMQHAARLWEDRGEAEHRVDGIIFQDTDAPYCSGTAHDDSCLKWKDHASVDLCGPPAELRASDAPLPEKLFERTVVVKPSRITATNDCVLEYHVTATADEVHLMAIRTRLDKDTANSLMVVMATLNDVLNHIQPDEIASVSRI